MDFFQYIQSQNIQSYEALQEHLKSDMIKIRVKEDRTYPDIFVLCHDDDTVKTSPIYHCTNGLIARKRDCMPLCFSFNKMEDSEMSEDGKSFIVNSALNLDACRLEYALEGTLIRVWKYIPEGSATAEPILMISTKRCIDAVRAKWISEKSFRELFIESMVGFDFNTLSVGYTYSFLLTHPENNMIVQYDKPISYHIATRNMSTMIEEDIIIPGIQRVPTQAIDRSNYEQYINFLIQNQIFNIEGYVIVDSSFKRQKFIAPSYAKAKELFGNTNSKMYKFFTLRKDCEKLRDYMGIFPQDAQEFSSYEYNFYQIATQIHKLYVNKFVKRPKDESGNVLMIPVPYYLKKVVYGLHSDYKTSKVQTNLERVFSKLSEQDVKLQCFIYNKMINNGATPITIDTFMASAFPKVEKESVSQGQMEMDA
jgi:hypothetical protein